MEISIPLGIAIGLLASCIQSLGITIQRKSHVLNESLPQYRRQLVYRRPLWLFGLAIFISSNLVGSVVQIASLPVVILAPLGAVSLLWNALFARIILRDVFSPWMILGTILIAGGAVLIAIFGVVPEPTRSLEDLLELFTRPAFVAYFSILGAVVAASLAITHIVELSFTNRPSYHSYSSHGPLEPQSNCPSTAASEDAPTENTPLLDHKSPDMRSSSPFQNEPFGTGRTRLLLSLSYASFSGIISGMCLIFAKSSVGLLLLTLRGDNQFWRWQAWMLLLGLGIFALLQLWYFHKALVLADPTIVCPSAFCFYNLSSIANGLVYFDQFSLIPPLHLCLVSLGIVILLGGVWIVSVPSEGGGVDLGTWQESEDIEDVISLPDSETESDIIDNEETRPPSIPLSSPPLRVSELYGGEGARSSTASAAEASLPSGLSSPTSHRRQITDSMLLVSPPSSPKRRRWWRRDTHSSLSPPGSGGSGAGGVGAGAGSALVIPGGGLQIGLSPISPGFAILPRLRQKRIFSGNSVEGGTIEGTSRSRSRRSFSESDMNRAPNRTLSPRGMDAGVGTQTDAREDGTDPARTVENDDGNPTLLRQRGLKWMRKVLTRRRI